MNNTKVLRRTSNFINETWIYFQIAMKMTASFAVVTVLFSMVIPFGVLLMVSLMPVQMTKEAAVLYISGNFMTSISNMCIMTLAQILANIRAKNGFEHYATLPVYTASPMLGLFFSFFITTLPSLIIMPILGMLLFKISFVISFWLIVVVLLTMVTMIGLGAVLGTFSDNLQKTNTIAMMSMFFVMFATPVYYPMESLPFVMRLFQRLLPFSYSLEAMRLLMVDPTLNFVVIRNILVLIVWMVASLFLASRFVSWKQKNRIEKEVRSYIGTDLFAIIRCKINHSSF